MNRSTFVSAISFFLFLIIQVLLFKKIVLFNTAFCFLYIAYILLLPVDTNPLLLMFLGLGLGLLVDMFYDHQGMHAAATVMVAYLRNYWLRVLTPQTGYDVGANPNLKSNGVVWFISYAAPLIILHHILLFFIDAGGFGLLGLSLAKSFASVIFTMTILILQQYFFQGSES
jgi:hypothetical protein